MGIAHSQVSVSRFREWMGSVDSVYTLDPIPDRQKEEACIYNRDSRQPPPRTSAMFLSFKSDGLPMGAEVGSVFCKLCFCSAGTA